MGVASKIKLNSIDSLFGSAESITEVMLSELHEFKDHPFKVFDDEAMEQLIESIRENGILVPATVRPLKDGGYEIISGHRRKHAAEKAGLSKIPVVIREMTDDEATIAMVDSNLQREEILPSEKAFAYKMKLEAEKSKNKVGRPKNGDENKGKTSIEIVAEEVGESRDKVQKYIRLTELDKELLELVDIKKLPLTVAVDLSYLSIDEQGYIIEFYNEYEKLPDGGKAKRLRELSNEKMLTRESAYAVLSEAKEKTKSLKLSDEVKKMIPYSLNDAELQEIMNNLLKEYLETHYDVTERFPF